MERKQPTKQGTSSPAEKLPDGSQTQQGAGSEVPTLPTQFSPEQMATIYAAVAHAHFALATLRGAAITFGPERTPPAELALDAPINQRFYVQLTLLGMALEALGLDPGKAIPLPQIRQQLIE